MKLILKTRHTVGIGLIMKMHSKIGFWKCRLLYESYKEHLMVKPRVLLILPTFGQSGVDYLSEHAELVYAPSGDESTLIEYVRRDIQAIVARTEVITGKIIRSGKSLRVIGENGVGTDNIDVQAATAEGIAVINVPKATAPSVGEHVAMMMLAVSRRLLEADRAVRSGDWAFRNREIPSEMMGKTVYMVGFGNNARETARILRNGFLMHLKAYDPFVSAEEMAGAGAVKVEDLYEGFEGSDYVSVHVPSIPATRHLIDREAFSRMQRAVFVNCSRGAVTDSRALCDALKNGSVIAAGLDVFEEEPPDIDSEILKFENVIVTPHFAGDTMEAKQRCALSLAKDVMRALENERPHGLVNRELEGKFNR